MSASRKPTPIRKTTDSVDKVLSREGINGGLAIRLIAPVHLARPAAVTNLATYIDAEGRLFGTTFGDMIRTFA